MKPTSFQFQRTWVRGMGHQKYVITAPNSKPFFMAEMRTGWPSLTNTSLRWYVPDFASVAAAVAVLMLLVVLLLHSRNNQLRVRHDLG